MSFKRLSQEHFNILKSGKHACPDYLSFIVGKEYTFKNPSNPKETIKARCTQSCPYALLKINK